MKNLNAKGNGEWFYDYENDMLIFKIKDRYYKSSLDLDDINLTVDIDEEGFITGIRIFDASKVFNTTKKALSKIKSFEFNSKIEEETIVIQLKFSADLKDETLQYGHDFIKEGVQQLENNCKAMCSL